jgi:hypothetical protein
MKNILILLAAIILLGLYSCSENPIQPDNPNGTFNKKSNITKEKQVEKVMNSSDSKLLIPPEQKDIVDPRKEYRDIKSNL